MIPSVPPFNWNSFLSSSSAAFQVPQNSNEATIQRTGESSFGYRQEPEHTIPDHGMQPPTRGTSSTEYANMGGSGHGSVQTIVDTKGHVDSFLELLRSTPN